MQNNSAQFLLFTILRFLNRNLYHPYIYIPWYYEHDFFKTKVENEVLSSFKPSKIVQSNSNAFAFLNFENPSTRSKVTKIEIFFMVCSALSNIRKSRFL